MRATESEAAFAGATSDFEPAPRSGRGANSPSEGVITSLRVVRLRHIRCCSCSSSVVSRTRRKGSVETMVDAHRRTLEQADSAQNSKQKPGLPREAHGF